MTVSIDQYQGPKVVTDDVRKCDLVSSHTARRTFATNCYLKGVPPRVIMRITGHKKEEMFFKYIRMTPTDDSKILQLMLGGGESLLKVV